MSNLSRIEFDATPEERNRLNMEAAAHGMSRKELIRERVLYPQRVASLGNGRDCIDRAITSGVPLVANTAAIPSGIHRAAKEPIICTHRDLRFRTASSRSCVDA